MATRRPLLVVEDDPALRFIGAILTNDVEPARLAAFRDFFAHDLADFDGWLSAVRKRLASLYPADVQFAASHTQMIMALPRADALIVEGYTVGAAEIACAPSLKTVQKFGTITSNIDLAACAARNVPVLVQRRRANAAVAEHALGLMLALAHKICETDGLVSLARLRAAGYAPRLFDRAHTSNSNWARIPGVRTLFGAQLGILGFGEIGRELSVRASACGMQVVYTQRTRLAPDDEARYHAHYATLDTLLAESDFVSLHLPVVATTQGVIGRRELEKIKPGAMLINAARAELVDRSALTDALAAGRVAGYATDLPFDEPALQDDPLLDLPNVIMTPHIAAQPRFNALDDFEEMLINISRVL